MFLGWQVVAASFTAQFLMVGAVFYAFGVFLEPLSAHFGWSRAQTSWGFSLATLCGAAYAPLLGRLVDRRGPRPVALGGVVALAVGFALLSRVESFLAYLVCMATIVALGSVALGPTTSNAAVSKWFVRKRGRALGVSTAGISMGGVVFAPLAQYLITELGWRDALLAIGGVVLLVGLPPIVAWMHGDPEAFGLLPDGDPAPPPAPLPLDTLARELERSVSPAEAVRSWAFWRIAFAFGLTIGGLSGILIHQVPFLIDRGFAPATAASVLQATAAMGVLGKLGFGSLADRFEERRVILACFVLQALGVVLLGLAETPLALVGYVVLYGWAMGGNATLQATVVGTTFGRLHYGAITGRMMPVIVTMQALFVPLIGTIRDRSGGYAPAFGVVVGASIGAVALMATLRPAEESA